MNLSDKYIVTIDNFDGPLDLLLHLIKEQDIDIYDIYKSEKIFFENKVEEILSFILKICNIYEDKDILEIKNSIIIAYNKKGINESSFQYIFFHLVAVLFVSQIFKSLTRDLT